MKLSDYVFNVLAGTGVKHVFMLPGGGCMHLCDSLGRNPDLTFVCNLHEQACAVAADAYGQYSNQLGVALVTTGPGGTNTLTGLAAAWLDSTPCLFLSGQVKRADMKGDRGVRQMGFQEVDIVRLVRPITKYAVTVTEPRTIRYHLERAIFLARHDRPGPVWIDIPLDVQAADVTEAELAPFDPAEVVAPTNDHAVEQAATQTARQLMSSERPVLLAGNGIRLDGATATLHQLLATLRIPVLTTWKAADLLPEDHPLYGGRPGAVGQRGANFAQQNSDCFISVGARLDLGQTGYVHRNFARGARKIVVDIDPTETDKLDMELALAVHCGAQRFLSALASALRGTSLPDFTGWLRRCKEWQRRYPVVLPQYRAAKDGVSNYVLLDVLSDCMAAEDLLVPGSSGACSETPMQTFRVKAGQRIFNSEGLGPMGFGIPAAIGGCLASGRRRTVCIDGDGGFAMNIQELEVVRRLALPIKFFVLDNNGYGSIRQTQTAYFGGRFVASGPSSGLTLPDYQRVARSFGLTTRVLHSQRGIRAKLRSILDHDGPVVCVVKVTPDQQTAPRVTSGQRKDGSLFSRPLEDLWPFLDRRELRENMIVPPVPEDDPSAP